MVYKPTYNWGAPSCIHFRCLVFSWLFTWRHAPFFRAEIWARPMVIRSMGDLIITWRSGVEELWRGYMMNLACLKKLSMLNFKKNACINIYIYAVDINHHMCIIHIWSKYCVYIYYYQIYYHISHIHTARASRIPWCRKFARWGLTAYGGYMAVSGHRPYPYSKAMIFP
jgi:hypothetical protein